MFGPVTFTKFLGKELAETTVEIIAQEGDRYLLRRQDTGQYTTAHWDDANKVWWNPHSPPTNPQIEYASGTLDYVSTWGTLEAAKGRFPNYVIE